MVGLELIVAGASVASEHLLAKTKRSGWIWSIVASILSGIFFLIRGHTVLVLVEVLNVPFALYGLHKWYRHTEKVTHVDTFMVYTALIVVIVYFFCGEDTTYAIPEAFASSAFLFGGLFVAREKRFGWVLCIVADIVLLYILLQSNDYIFVLFQLLSIGIALQRIFKKSKKTISTKHDPSGSCFYIY